MGSLEDLYKRLQDKFDIEEVTEDDLRRWIYNGRTGPKSSYSKGTRGGVPRARIDADTYRTYRGTKRLEDSDIDNFMAAPKMYKEGVGNPQSLPFSGAWKQAVIDKFAGVKKVEVAEVRAAELAERGDISGLRSYANRVKGTDLDERIVNPEEQSVSENYFYNAVRSSITDLRSTKDLEGLRALKDDVRGARDELELLEEIDDAIRRTGG